MSSLGGLWLVSGRLRLICWLWFVGFGWFVVGWWLVEIGLLGLVSWVGLGAGGGPLTKSVGLIWLVSFGFLGLVGWVLIWWVWFVGFGRFVVGWWLVEIGLLGLVSWVGLGAGGGPLTKSA